jgi:recombination protein RecT
MAQTNQTTTQATQDAAKKPQNGGAIQKRAPTVIDQVKAGFEQWRPTLAAVLPKHLDPDRVIKMSLMAVMRSPDLQRCTPISIVKAAVTAAEMGLEVGSFLGEAYLVPFKNKKQVRDGNTWKEVQVTEAQLIPGYKGLIKLARQTGDISEVYAVIVDKNEHARSMFRVILGTTREVHHEMLLEDRAGEMFAVYGVVRFKDGSKHFEVLTKAQVDAIRARSKASGAGPWVTDYEWMARKTAIKQALKTVTLSPEKPKDLQTAMALAADDAADAGEAFRSELADAIDTDGEPMADPEPERPATRTDAIGAKLGVTPAHDPVTGEVKE